MHRLFISDLHLDDPSSPQFLRFDECLAVEARVVDEIYILGDLVEMWIGDDDDGPLARALMDSLRRTTAQCAVFLMHGNRDFLFKEPFAERTGVRLIEDMYQPDADLLLCHGDLLCTDDTEYQTLRKQLRGNEWQQEFLSQSLAERRAFGADLRKRSQQENANKAESIMDANSIAIAQAMSEYSAQTLIHGHTHRPELDNMSEQRQRIVLGAWERCGWLCRQQTTQFELQCFSLARHYGT